MKREKAEKTGNFESRVEAIAARLEAVQADAMLISAMPNIRYLSGFTGSNGLLVITRGGATLFTDPRYTLQAELEVRWPVRIAKGTLIKAVCKWAERRKVRRVAVERNRISWEAVEQIRAAAPQWELVSLDGAVEELRMVKSPAEAEWIRKSVDTNSRAFEAAMAKFRPGMRESELAAEIEYQQRLAGAEGAAFETIVAAGARSALPHARPTNAAIPERGILLIDMGCIESGYASDMTRTLYIGKAPSKFKAMYRAVLEAQAEAIEKLRPGVTADRVDGAARKVLEKAGYGREFVHSTGHGLGLEIHEPPRLGKKGHVVLNAGFAVTVEPGVYVDGYGGVRIEDTVLVNQSGHAVLTPTAKELIEW